MNGFCHAFPFLDQDPYFLAGTAIPDWLSMIDRRVRVRRNRSLDYCDDASASTRELARGVVQHHDDDDWFHRNRCFVQLNLDFAQELRDLLKKDAGFRPHLVAHIVIEMLLDGYLMTDDPSRLDLYYQKIGRVDPLKIQSIVNRFAIRQTRVLAGFVPRFLSEGYLYDYVDDYKVGYRMNRILSRVGLEPLPREFLAWLPSARARVNRQARVLLPDRCSFLLTGKNQ